ncbi:hypothetical protein ACFPM7_23200 [Actinokineospora guangxiensis]|uniref:Lantibiotic biosynthesis dehydratase-like protein n=1 Tax=Actinokineospora guangxiensis TaxID=1490288 RepID=A0ABW0ERX2_9PSEU
MTAADVLCFYRAPIKAPLLRAVLPALPDDAHVERHWLRGPHLLFRVPDGAAARRFADVLRDRLAALPSTSDITEARLLAESEVAGRAELVPPPYGPIQPDNTVAVREVDRARVVSILGERTALLRDTALADGVPAVSDLLARLGAAGDSPTERVLLACSAMAAIAAGHPSGCGLGAQSFRSHVDGLLFHEDTAGVLRARFDRAWSDGADEVVLRVRAAIDGAETRWTSWQSATRGLGALAGPPTGHSATADRFGDPALSARWRPATPGEGSEYHRVLARIDLTAPAVAGPLTAHRFTTNMLYLLLAVCDLAPVERLLAADLTARAVEVVTGLTWREQLAAVTGG